MRFAGEAVSDSGYPPRLSDAIAALQDAMADFAEVDPALFALADYETAADRIGALSALPEAGAEDRLAEQVA